jgi:two-component system, NarL family, invasion response regulator UvrY
MPIHVLVVDDHSVSRRGLRETIADFGGGEIVVAGEAANGEEAISLLRKGSWNAVILDISLPGDNGLDVLRRMKTEWPDLPVIAYSAFPEEYYGLRMIEAGASGYLTKDGPEEEIVTALRKVVSGGKYIRVSQAEMFAQKMDRSSAKPLHFSLSEREFEVFCLLGNGMTVKKIAHKLSLSDKTITTYRQRVMEKMQMQSNMEIIRYVLENHLEAPGFPSSLPLIK